MAQSKLSTSIIEKQSSRPVNPGRMSGGIIGANPVEQKDRMVNSSIHSKTESDLADMLGELFPDITVDIGLSKRWDRVCVTFRWGGFAGLLPEERFHRLVGVIPEDFRTKKMIGFIWLELEPQETIDSFMKQPRSEDIGNRELEIDASLRRVGFYGALQKTMSAKRNKGCPGDFSLSQQILVKVKCNDQQIIDARLLFIRFGAYCDCQVLQSVEPAFSKRHAAAG